MLAVRLPKDIQGRLVALAAKTGCTKTFCAKEAILEYMDDMEDKYLPSAVQKTAITAEPWKNYSKALIQIVEFDDVMAKELHMTLKQLR